MTPEDIEKAMKLLALITQGVAKLSDILANKATQGGMDTDAIFARAEQHNNEALEIINNL